jgi:hypothetical protein
VEGIPKELIFVLIFIVFSVLEGMGRKKKAQRQGGAGMVPPSRPRSDQREGETGSVPETVVASVAAPSADSTTEPDASEGVIPEDVWSEILELARGTPPPTPAPEPKPPEEPVEESSWDRGIREAQLVEERPETQVTSLESLEARTDVAQVMPDRDRVSPSSEKIPAQRVAVPLLGKARSSGSSALQELFGDGSVKELQKAIILQEVLGPPVGMKE